MKTNTILNMGTNYYAYKYEIEESEYQQLSDFAQNHDIIAIQGWIDERRHRFENSKIHIGKSSGGWAFLFNHNNWKYYDFTRESITRFLESCYIIRDEYGKSISIEDLWKLIDHKATGFNGKSYSEFELKKAMEKEKRIIQDPFNMIPTVAQATRLLEEGRRNNYYEELFYKNSLIPYNKLNYRFSNSTEFS